MATAHRRSGRSRQSSDGLVNRKLVAFAPETWHAVNLLAKDSMKSFQELADEAFLDLLKKHGRSDDLRTALRKSAADAEGRVRRDR